MGTKKESSEKPMLRYIRLRPLSKCKIPSEDQEWAGELNEILWYSAEYIWSLSLITGTELHKVLGFPE